MVVGLSVLMYLTIAVLIVRFIAKVFHINIKQPILHYLTEEKTTYPGSETKRKDLIQVFFSSLIIRLCFYAASAFIIFGLKNDTGEFSIRTFLDYWNRWDGTHYIRLAKYGYNGYIENGQHLFLVFFPLYPYLMKLVHFMIPNYKICGMILSTLCYSAGCVYLYALVARDYSKRIAERSILYISVFPFSFFFGGIMTESLFFLTSVATLYYIRGHKWGKMMIWGALCSFSRMAGILLILAAAVEMIEYYDPITMLKEKRIDAFRHFLITKVSCLFAIPIGTVLYLLLNYQVCGNPFQFSIYQKDHWSQGKTLFSNVIQYVYDYAFVNKDVGFIRFTIWIPTLALFIIGLITLLLGIRRHRNMYLFYFLAYFLLNYSLTWLLSAGRYMLCTVPMFIIWAEAAEKNRILHTLIVTASAVFLGVYFCGYMFSMQVM